MREDTVPYHSLRGQRVEHEDDVVEGDWLVYVSFDSVVAFLEDRPACGCCNHSCSYPSSYLDIDDEL